MKKFNNTPNEEFSHNGETYFKHRSIAVAVFPLIEDSTEFLITQRSEKMTHPGKWCCPCGYLDWDETLEEAAQRELYEETGIYVENLSEFQLVGINSNPKDFRQNVTMRFIVNIPQAALHDLQLSEEVTDFGFFDPYSDPSGEDFAFNHDKIMEELI